MSNPFSAHFLLFSEARVERELGIWRFVLAKVGASDSFSATDAEPAACRERLELLAVVRGLEAIDQPARVTLVTNSRYVTRGLKHGLGDWRASDWHWERFGQLAPVRNHDLWRRVDRALQFHHLDCRFWRFDSHTGEAPAPARVSPNRVSPPKKHRRRAASHTGVAWDGPLHPAGLAAG